MKRFWERGDTSRLPPERVARITMILDRLDAATQPQDLNLPGLAFHQLVGQNRGRYAVAVTANWRITFAFDGLDAVDVDFEDYH